MTPSRSAGGLLLAAARAGELAPIAWAVVTLATPQGELVVTVATDALSATIDECSAPVRLPVSYAETIEICRSLGCVAPTAAISDAVWRAATARCHPIGLVRTAAEAAQMGTVEYVLAHHRHVEADIVGAAPGALVADPGKDWILDPGLAVRGAVNYGWRYNTGIAVQPIGHAHNAQHFDYAQVLRLVLRAAVLAGERVDLLDYYARTIDARWLAPYR